MTSKTPNLHVSKNLNISRTKQDIEKLKTPLRLVWKCCSVVFKIGSKNFSLQWQFKNRPISSSHIYVTFSSLLKQFLDSGPWDKYITIKVFPDNISQLQISSTQLQALSFCLK